MKKNVKKNAVLVTASLLSLGVLSVRARHQQSRTRRVPVSRHG